MNENTLYILLAIFFLWIFYRALNRLAHSSFFFPTRDFTANPQKHELAFEEVFFHAGDRTSLHGWFIPHPNPVATLLFLHGNSGNISHCLQEITLWHHIGLAVFVVDYRGYGKSAGKPHEKGLYRDAEAAYHYLIEERQISADKIICFGRSLGGAVAIRLAMHRSLRALIISSTFTSVNEMISLLFPRWLVPILKLLNPISMPSVNLVPYLKCPLLVVHGDQDELIPWTMGKKLYEYAPNPKMWYMVAGGKHNDTFIVGGKKYWYLLESFVKKVIADSDLVKKNTID